jgi:hypothetical protein
MPASRTVLAKAEVSGATQKNPQRYRNRRGPVAPKPLGEPYPGMPEHELAVWQEMAGNMPWLNVIHRTLLRLVCRLAGKLALGEITPSEGQLLSSTLSKLGATPVDETKVAHGDGDGEEDPTESFFARPN